MTTTAQSTKLYHYWRSSCSFRVRIALALKEIDYESILVNLLEKAEYKEDYAKLNQQNMVPTLVTQDGTFTQSMAILEYLDERYPSPSLLPKELDKRAQVRAFSFAIASDVQPINNTPVTSYLNQHFKASQDETNVWHQFWMKKTFAALERIAALTHGKYTFGDTITMADICLIPQVYNAFRFNVDMTEFPTLLRINENCSAVEAFSKAHPSHFL